MPSTAIRRPSRFGPACRVKIVKVSGINMPPPRPCTTRNAMSSMMFGAIAHSSEPTANDITEPMNSRLVPNLSAAQPATGITVAIASVWPVIVQATTAWVDPNTAINVRWATATTVVSRIAIITASTHTPAICSSPASSLSG
jgi:hypothetical protein